MRRRELLTANAGIIIEHNQYYPNLVQYLENKYGFGFGSLYSPIAIEENIFIGDSFAGGVGSGQVKFLCISSTPGLVGILLYLENHKETRECVALLNTVGSYDYGIARTYFYE